MVTASLSILFDLQCEDFPSPVFPYILDDHGAMPGHKLALKGLHN